MAHSEAATRCASGAVDPKGDIGDRTYDTITVIRVSASRIYSPHPTQNKRFRAAHASSAIKPTSTATEPGAENRSAQSTPPSGDANTTTQTG